MLKNFCIWYLNKKKVSVFLNFELMGTDVNLKTNSKKIYVTEIRGDGELNIYQ